MKGNKNFKTFFIVFILLLLAGGSTILFKKNISYSAQTIMKYEDLVKGTFVPFDTVITIAQKHSAGSSRSFGHTYILYCSDEVSKEECSSKLYEAGGSAYSRYDWSDFDTEYFKHVRLDEGSSYRLVNYSDVFSSSEAYVGWSVINEVGVGDDNEAYYDPDNYSEWYNNLATVGIALYPTKDEVKSDGNPSISNDYETCVKCNDEVPTKTTWYKFTPINLSIYDYDDNVVFSSDSDLKEKAEIDMVKEDYRSYKLISDKFDVKSGDIVSFKGRGSSYYQIYGLDPEDVNYYDYDYFNTVVYSQESLYSTYQKEINIDSNIYFESYFDSYVQNYIGLKEFGVLTRINDGLKLDKNGLSNGDIIYYESECESGFKWAGYLNYTTPSTYSVIYNGNGATDGTVPIDNEVYLGGSSYTVLGNTGNLKKNTAAFAGWSKSVISEIINEANDAVLEPGSTDSIVDSDVNLYAVYCVDDNQNGICDYKETKHSVIYNKGIGTVGTVPVDNNKYLDGIKYIVKGNTGNLSTTNAVFDGWSTSLIEQVITSHYDGTIDPGSERTMSSDDVTYYALYCADLNNNNICDYKENKYKVTYNKALATTGNVPIDNNSYLSGLTYTVKGNTGNLDMVKATFDGWSTTELTEIVTARYVGTVDPDTVVTMGTNDVLYYAIFAEDINENEIADYKEDKYNVIYHKNIATSGTVPVDSNKYLTKLTAKVLDNTGDLKLEKAIFIGWSKEELGLLTEKDTTHNIYTKDNSIIISDSDINLNAVFCADTNENNICDYNEDGYTVKYDKNTATSGEVPVDKNKYLEKYTYRIKDNTGNLDADKATFVGWSLKELPIIKEYDNSIVDPDTEIEMGTSDVLYFAVLAEDLNNNEIADYLEDRYTVTYDGNGATSGNVPVDNNKYLTLLSYEVMDNTGNLSKENAKFVGWSTTKLEDSTEITEDLIQPGTINTIKDSDIVYYAVWQKNEEVKNPNTKSFVIWAIVLFISISLILITISNKKIVKYE